MTAPDSSADGKQGPNVNSCLSSPFSLAFQGGLLGELTPSKINDPSACSSPHFSPWSHLSSTQRSTSPLRLKSQATPEPYRFNLDAVISSLNLDRFNLVGSSELPHAQASSSRAPGSISQSFDSLKDDLTWTPSPRSATQSFYDSVKQSPAGGRMHRRSLWTPSPPSPPTARHARAPSPSPKSVVEPGWLTQDDSTAPTARLAQESSSSPKSVVEPGWMTQDDVKVSKLKLPEPPSTLSELSTASASPQVDTEEEPRRPPEPSSIRFSSTSPPQLFFSDFPRSSQSADPIRSAKASYQGATIAASVRMMNLEQRFRLGSQAIRFWRIAAKGAASATAAASWLVATRLSKKLCLKTFNAFKGVLLDAHQRSLEHPLHEAPRLEKKISVATRRAIRLASVRAMLLWVVIDGWRKATQTAKRDQVRVARIFDDMQMEGSPWMKAKQCWL